MAVPADRRVGRVDHQPSLIPRDGERLAGPAPPCRILRDDVEDDAGINKRGRPPHGAPMSIATHQPEELVGRHGSCRAAAHPDHEPLPVGRTLIGSDDPQRVAILHHVHLVTLFESVTVAQRCGGWSPGPCC